MNECLCFFSADSGFGANISIQTLVCPGPLGLLNTIRQAQASTGVDKLHALIGGFHLVPPLGDDYVRQTVADLKALDPDYIVAAQCSGERFYDMARAEMPGRIVQANVGSRFSCGTRA